MKASIKQVTYIQDALRMRNEKVWKRNDIAVVSFKMKRSVRKDIRVWAFPKQALKVRYEKVRKRNDKIVVSFRTKEGRLESIIVFGPAKVYNENEKETSPIRRSNNYNAAKMKETRIQDTTTSCWIWL